MSRLEGGRLAPEFTPDPGRSPYCWVTWISKLLGGENKCRWAAWYKARHKYEKVAPTAERVAFLEEWTKTHDAMVRARIARIRDERPNAVVRSEDDAAFRLVGRGATLSGQPDVVALEGDKADVFDQKSGRRRESDHWQVLVYLYALPLTWLGRTIKARGFVEYRDGLVAVRPLGGEERGAIVAAMVEVASPMEPPRTPSRYECKFCDVAKCPDRAIDDSGGGAGDF